VLHKKKHLLTIILEHLQKKTTTKLFSIEYNLLIKKMYIYFYSLKKDAMKKTLLLSTFIFICSILYSQSKIKGQTLHKPSFEQFKGKVKTLEVSIYDAEDKLGEAVKTDLEKKYLETYSIDGNKLEEVHYLNNNVVSEKFNFEYDKNGNLLNETKYNASGRMYEKYVYKYNDKGYLTEVLDYNSDTLVDGKSEYVNDVNGNAIEEKDLNSNGIVYDSYTYKYDDKGNLIEENDYNSRNILNEHFVYKYDANGNLIENSIYNSSNLLFDRFTYVYDEKGNVIEEIDYNGDGAIFKKNVYKYHYDQNGNWTKRTKYNVLNENTKEPDSIIEIKIGYFN
jgi:hypothetical protein